MKPVILEIEAFGAFAEKQSIRFKAFEENRLFLIHGPTGAGKTTLFDAMCYALYGETTGNRKGLDMRSDHVSEEVPTQVNFIFQAGQHFYKTERKLTVSKVGNVNDKHSFCEVIWDEKKGEFIENSSPLTKIREIEDKVKSLLGFDANQFKQIVILPQGKFQELLLSDTKQKEEILIQLFNARIYENITQKLIENAKEQKKLIQEKENKIIARLESAGIEKAETFDEIIKQLDEQLKQAEEELPRMDKSYKTAFQTYQEQQQLSADFQEWEELQKTLILHENKKATIQSKEDVFNLAEKAEYLRSLLRAVKESEENLTDKKEAVRTNQSILENSIKPKLSDADNKFEKAQSLKPQIQGNEIKIKELREHKPKFAELDHLKKNHQESKEELQTVKETIKQAEENLENNKKKLQKNEEESEKLEDWVRKKSGLEKQVKDFEDWNTLRNELNLARAEFKKIKESSDNALQILNKAAEIQEQKSNVFNILEKKWRASQSALLAEQLKDGEACPVCGSVHHPQPAPKTDEFVSNVVLDIAKAERDTAQKDWDKAREKYNELENQLSKLEGSGKELSRQLGDKADMGEDNFKKLIDKIQNDFKTSETAETDIQKLKAANQDLKTQNENIEKQIKAANRKAEESNVIFLTSKENIKHLEEKLPADLKSETELEKHILLLDEKNLEMKASIENAEKKLEEAKLNETKILTTIKNLEKDIQDKASDLEDKQKDFQRRAKERGFKTEEEVKNALLGENEKTTLKKDIEDWKNTQIEIGGKLQQAEKKIIGKQKPDLTIAEEDLTRKETLRNECSAKLENLKSEKKSLEKQAEDIRQLNEELQKTEEEAKHIIELADLANGNNELNQRFQTYVLSALLDDVVEYANKRLRILSQDRYQLQRTEEIAHGLRKSGLDLKVFDSYSGKERPVHNLSGGETFFTSLALALGLADVATANAGGIRLDAMFIDEGFGTLDNETLDLAIKTLMNLDGEYRLVGIISHVAELKERISSNRLEVVKGRNGSSIKIHAEHFN